MTKKKINTGLLISWVVWMGIQSAFAQQTYDSCIEQGLAATKAQHYDEAIDFFRQALRLSPNDIRNALTYANIAHVQVAQGNPHKALASYDMALGIAPLNLPILKAQADLYLSLGNLNKALMNYSKILDIDPNHVDALLNRAYIRQQHREFLSAKEDYERLLTLQPDNYAALLGVVLLYQNADKLQEALSRLSVLIDQYPDKAELYSIRAEIEAEAGQTELALMDLNRAIDLEPENKNLVLTRAYLHLKEDHKHLAKKDFERARYSTRATERRTPTMPIATPSTTQEARIRNFFPLSIKASIQTQSFYTFSHDEKNYPDSFCNADTRCQHRFGTSKIAIQQH